MEHAVRSARQAGYYLYAMAICWLSWRLSERWEGAVLGFLIGQRLAALAEGYLSD